MIYYLSTLPFTQKGKHLKRGSLLVETLFEDDPTFDLRSNKDTIVPERKYPFRTIYNKATSIKYPAKTLKPVLYGFGMDNESPHVLIMDIPFKRGEYISSVVNNKNMNIITHKISERGITMVLYVPKHYHDGSITFIIASRDKLRYVNINKVVGKEPTYHESWIQGPHTYKHYTLVRDKQVIKLPELVYAERKDVSELGHTPKKYNVKVRLCDKIDETISEAKKYYKEGYRAIGVFIPNGLNQFDKNIHELLKIMDNVVVFDKSGYIRVLKPKQLHRRDRKKKENEDLSSEVH